MFPLPTTSFLSHSRHHSVTSLLTLKIAFGALVAHKGGEVCIGWKAEVFWFHKVPVFQINPQNISKSDSAL